MTTFLIVTGAVFWSCAFMYFIMWLGAVCDGRPWNKKEPRTGGNRYEAVARENRR